MTIFNTIIGIVILLIGIALLIGVAFVTEALMSEGQKADGWLVGICGTIVATVIIMGGVLLI